MDGHGKIGMLVDKVRCVTLHSQAGGRVGGRAGRQQGGWAGSRAGRQAG